MGDLYITRGGVNPDLISFMTESPSFFEDSVSKDIKKEEKEEGGEVTHPPPGPTSSNTLYTPGTQWIPNIYRVGSIWSDLSPITPNQNLFSLGNSGAILL